jgi:dienelactone hydrolase
MNRALLLGVALSLATSPGVVLAQDLPNDDPIAREKLSLAGWDPDEPVPALLWYPKGKPPLPVVLFVHGLGGSKDGYEKRMRELAGKGFFVVAIDAHLHGERKVPGMFFKNLGQLGDDYSIWVHQSAIAHTSRDISRIIDSLSARPEVDRERIGLVGISMGSCTCLVTAWREPRIDAAVCLIGAVDHWYDVTKTPPGPEQDAKRAALSPRVRQLVDSVNSRERMNALAPKALLLANGAKDKGIDIESIRSFVKDLRPSYAAYPERLAFLEEPDVGHSVTERMWNEGSQWLLRHLVERPIRSAR